MRKLLTIILLTLLASSLFAWRDNEMEVRVYYGNDYELNKLVNLHPKGDIYPNGEALIYLIPTEYEALKATGLKYKIEREDVKTYAENFWQSQDNTREAYHTYSEIIDLADSLASAFPDICEKHIFGTSVQGRELGALKISDNVTLDENEAEVMFDGGIHGDEIGAAENCIRFARDLCLEYGIDPDITDLVNNRETWIYYMVNPDGRVADNRTNSNGVDLNRDSGYMWDAWGGSPGAFSQPESKALRDCHYNRQFVVHTTYHSGTEYISHPWSYRADLCPDFSHINQLAGVYSSTSGYANMEYGQGCTGMYAINGSTKDTNYGMMGAISWSMEISYNKHPAASQLMMYYNYNKPAMLSIIEYAGYGLEGVVTDIDTGYPIAGAVFINDYFPTYTDANFGDYHKYVLAGTYDITVKANGYETQTITGISVASGSSTATDFQLQPLEGQYVYKVASSQIPDNNTADEGDTPGVIGVPDNRNYSIGKDGWIVVDMEYPVPDGEGNDLMIYEGDTSAEGYTVYAGETIDGPWISLGEGVGTAEFDLAEGNIIEAQFFKIEDDGDGVATLADAGFDLDAVESIAEVYIAIEDFETANFLSFDWEFGGTHDWIISTNYYEGLFSATSGAVYDDESSSLMLDVEVVVEGELSFYKKVSSENGWDFLKFYLDNVEMGSWSGEVDWSLETYPVSAGTHTFKWEYVKDGSGSNGSDCGWIDYVVFPPVSIEEYFGTVQGTVTDTDTGLPIEGVNIGGYAVTNADGWFTFDIEVGIYDIICGAENYFNFIMAGLVVLENQVTTVDFEMQSSVPPANISAEIVDYNSSIIISWGGSVRFKQKVRDILGYNIYFDGVFVANVTSSPYIFAGPFAPGDYYFEITAVYDEGESEAAEITVTIVLNPPENLTAISSGNDIILIWELPIPVRGIVEYNIYHEGLEIGTTTSTTCTIEDIPSGEYTYFVTVVYDGGYESDFAEVTIDHTDSNDLLKPNVTELVGNYPNPFNPTTTISFALKEAGFVSIDIFNMKGQLVRTLINEEMTAVYHNVVWDGKDSKNKQATSGIYFYKMKAGKYQETKKMILMK